MHFATAFIILSLGLLFCAVNADRRPPCNMVCTREYKPVCGSLRQPSGKVIRCTFANGCVLNARRCNTREQWTGKAGRCGRDSPACKQLRG